MHKISYFFTMIIFLAVSCNSQNVTGIAGTPSPGGESVSENAITNLVCGTQKDCFSKICAATAACPLPKALSDRDVFDFVTTHAECEGCETETFAPEKGIGKCVEYRIADESLVWTVTFWVSEKCKFRYGDPEQSRIDVVISKETLAIVRINPAAAYIHDPSYCRVDADCRGLSGSGVPLIGCSNFLYAPLNWSGYHAYSNEECACDKHQCKQK